jgi:hypothetical protein
LLDRELKKAYNVNPAVKDGRAEKVSNKLHMLVVHKRK